MEHILQKQRWSPYIVGASIGLLNVVAVYFFKQTIGTSSTFERLGVLLYKFVWPHMLEVWHYHFSSAPLINWQVAFVIGIFCGAVVSVKLSGYTPTRIPSLWQANFGSSFNKRALGAFIGGIIIMLGARIARGCTSGHAISGGMQLATAGWLFMIALFASGIITAHLLYRKGV